MTTPTSKSPRPGISEASQRVRVATVFVVFVFFFSVIAFRLVQLQILPSADLDALAARQFQRNGRVAPFRLPIFDRNGEELALSIPANSIFIRPKLVRNRRRAAKALAQVFGGSIEKWQRKIDPAKNFIWIQRQVSAEMASRLSKKAIPGVFVEPENRRLYPNGELAAPLLGFTDIDGNGLAGIELGLNKTLLQEEPKFSILRDGKGNVSYVDKKYPSRAEESRGVYLTLDRRVQHALEEELDRAMRDTGARAAFGVVMDPYSGEIFGLAQRPSFDPNRFKHANPQFYANRLISHLFEPGSTLKTVFVAEAIERKLVKPETLIDCEGGHLTIGNKTIGEADSSHLFHRIPVSDILKYSSNVGAVKIGQRLEEAGVRQTLEKFGLTQKTGILLPGEAVPPGKPEDYWTPIHLATASFGQGISMTPLQLVLAYAPIANGGYRIQPRIVQSEENPPEIPDESQRLLSPETVKKMRAILTEVTESGTGRPARVEDIRVAGKTGTAQKYEAGAGYASGKYYSSFVGFLPADRPELLIGVMVDEPKREFYAAQVAAPLFQRVAERSLTQLNRFPKQQFARAPAPQAPSPAALAGAPATPPHEETALPKLERSPDGIWSMPDLRGYGLAQVIQVLGTHIDKVRIAGNGYVHTQSPRPGEKIYRNSEVSIVLKPSEPVHTAVVVPPVPLPVATPNVRLVPSAAEATIPTIAVPADKVAERPDPIHPKS